MNNYEEYNPIAVLKDKNDKTLDRYNSFNQKLSFYLTILTIMISVFVIFFQASSSNIKYLFIITTNDCLGLFVQYGFVIFFIILVFIVFSFLILIFKEILSALEPITLSEIDLESVDFYIDNQKKKAFKQICKDYKYVIKENQEKINEKYDSLYIIKRNFNIFLGFYFTIIIFIMIISLYFTVNYQG